MNDETLVSQILLSIGSSLILETDGKRTLIDAILSGTLTPEQAELIEQVLKEDLELMKNLDGTLVQ